MTVRLEPFNGLIISCGYKLVTNAARPLSSEVLQCRFTANKLSLLLDITKAAAIGRCPTLPVTALLHTFFREFLANRCLT